MSALLIIAVVTLAFLAVACVVIAAIGCLRDAEAWGFFLIFAGVFAAGIVVLVASANRFALAIALVMLLTFVAPSFAEDNDGTQARDITIADMRKLLDDLDRVCHEDWRASNDHVRRLLDKEYSDKSPTDLIPVSETYLRIAVPALCEWHEMNDYQRFGHRMRCMVRRAKARLFELRDKAWTG